MVQAETEFNREIIAQDFIWLNGFEGTIEQSAKKTIGRLV